MKTHAQSRARELSRMHPAPPGPLPPPLLTAPRKRASLRVTGTEKEGPSGEPPSDPRRYRGRR